MQIVPGFLGENALGMAFAATLALVADTFAGALRTAVAGALVAGGRGGPATTLGAGAARFTTTFGAGTDALVAGARGASGAAGFIAGAGSLTIFFGDGAGALAAGATGAAPSAGAARGAGAVDLGATTDAMALTAEPTAPAAFVATLATPFAPLATAPRKLTAPPPPLPQAVHAPS